MPRLLGVLKVIGLVLCAAWLLYVAVGNALLLSGFVEKQVNRDERKLRVRLDEAWTGFPGFVDVSGFELRLQDPKVQMQLRIPRAAVRLNLFRLLARELRLSDARLEGVSLRLRWRVEEGELQAPAVRAYPEIEGLPSAQKPAEPSRPQAKDTWTVRIRDADVAVDELWIQQYRRLGGMRARGDFAIRPTRWVEVPGARFELAPAPCAYGENAPLAERLEGAFTMKVEHHDVLRVPIEERLSLDGWANASVRDLAAFSDYLPGGASVAGGVGPLHVRTAIVNGLVASGSLVRYDGRKVRVRAKQATASMDVAVRFEAASKPEGPASLSLDAKRLAVTHPKLGGADLGAARVEARLLAEPVRLSGGTRPRRGVADVHGIGFSDLGALGIERGKLALRGGRVRGDARVEMARTESLSVSTDLELLGVRLRYGRATIRAQGRLEGTAHQEMDGARLGRIERGKLLLSSVEIDDGRGGSVRGWANAIAKQLETRRFEPTRVSAVVRGRFDDAEPVLNALGIAREGLPRTARGLIKLDRLAVEGRVDKTPAGTLLRLDEANAGGAQAKGALFVNGSARRGAIFADLPVTDVGIRFRDKETEVDLFAGDDWLARELARLDLPKP